MNHREFNENDFYNPNQPIGSAQGPLNLGEDTYTQSENESFAPSDTAYSQAEEENKNTYEENNANEEPINNTNEEQYNSTSEKQDNNSYEYKANEEGRGYNYTHQNTSYQYTPYPEIDPMAIMKSINSKSKIITILSSATFILSFISIFLALSTAISSLLKGGSMLFPAILFAIIPLASIVIGVILLGYHQKGGKNIIAGAFSLFLISSICFSNGNDLFYGLTSKEADSYIESIEALLAIDLPDGDSSYYEYEDGDKYADIYFKKSDLKKLREFVKSYPHFKAEIPTSLMGLVAGNYVHSDAEALLLYNIDTKEFNKAPATPGKYRMLAISLTVYEGGESVITIYEETIKYTTEFKEISGQQNQNQNQTDSDF